MSTKTERQLFTPLKSCFGKTWLFDSLTRFINLLAIMHDNGVIASESLWKQFAFVVDLSPDNLKDRILKFKDGKPVMSDDGKKQILTWSYFKRQYQIYCGRVKTDDKEKVIIRLIDRSWVYWTNRRDYGKWCEAIKDVKSPTLLTTESKSWELIGGITLSTNKDAEPTVQDLSKWELINFQAEYRRISHLEERSADFQDLAKNIQKQLDEQKAKEKAEQAEETQENEATKKVA